MSLDRACFGQRHDEPPKRARLPGMREVLTVPHPAAPDPGRLPHFDFAPGALLDVSGTLAKVIAWDPAHDQLEVEYVDARS